MGWTSEQREALKQEYERIGFVPGELWPTPATELSPDEVLALLRSVPSGSGRVGYEKVLAERDES